MKEPKNRNVVIGIFVSLMIVTTLHFVTPVENAYFHDVYDRLYYIPIILSAFFFGARGGGLVAVITGLIFLSHLILQWNHHLHHMDLTGRYLEILMYLVVGVLIGLLSDLERKQRRKTEEAYVRLKESFEKAKESARLAALGTLAAGVAHEIRNPLGGVKGAMEIVSAEIPQDHPKRRFVDIIDKELARIERIVGDFLGFSRPRDPVLAPDQINSVIHSVLELSGKNMDKNGIVLKTDFDESIPVAFIDSNQIKQVALNLILNGIDSMDEGGTLEITTRKAGDEIVIKVADTGKGIPPGEAERLFEPFYTNKSNGTGLGLPISKQIIERHGGTLTIGDRDGGSGAMAEIRIPIRSGE